MTFVEFIAPIPPQYYLIVGASLFVGLITAFLGFWRIRYLNKQSVAAVEQAKIANQKQYSEIIEKAFNILNEGDSPYSPMAMSILNGAVLDKDKFKHLYLSLVDVLINLTKKPKGDRTASEQVNIQHLVNFITHAQSPLWNNDASVNFKEADLEEINKLSESIVFDGCDFTGLNFSNRRFPRFGLKNCCFEQCDFSGSVFMPRFIDDCSFEGASFKDSHLTAGEVTETNFTDCDFDSAWWREGQFIKCQFVRADFLHSRRLEKTDKIEDGSVLYFSGCDFRESMFCKTHLSRTAFVDCYFSKTKLINANMVHSTFSKCTFMWIETIGFHTLNNVEFEECTFTESLINIHNFVSSRFDRTLFIASGIFIPKHEKSSFLECRQYKLKILGDGTYPSMEFFDDAWEFEIKRYENPFYIGDVSVT